MANGTTDDGAGDRPHEHGRILVLGANGPTGRQTVEQGLARGWSVAALTRHPETFPIRHERLDVLAGDATDRSVIDAAVVDADAVVCTIGAMFTRQPVEVYSASARLLVEAMDRHRKRRLVVVTSSGLAPVHAGAGIVSKFARSVMRDRVGKTVYDDMAAMESIVSASDLDWTIVRPPGLTNQPGVGYAVAEDEIEGGICSREDLAALLLDQLDDDRFVRRVAAMTSPGMTASAWSMIWHEMLKR